MSGPPVPWADSEMALEGSPQGHCPVAETAASEAATEAAASEELAQGSCTVAAPAAAARVF